MENTLHIPINSGQVLDEMLKANGAEATAEEMLRLLKLLEAERWHFTQWAMVEAIGTVTNHNPYIAFLQSVILGLMLGYQLGCAKTMEQMLVEKVS